MRTRKSRSVVMAIVLMVGLCAASMAFAVTPKTETETSVSQAETWSPWNILLQAWKLVWGVGGEQTGSEDPGTNTFSTPDQDQGPRIDPNGTSHTVEMPQEP